MCLPTKSNTTAPAADELLKDGEEWIDALDLKSFTDEIRALGDILEKTTRRRRCTPSQQNCRMVQLVCSSWNFNNGIKHQLGQYRGFVHLDFLPMDHDCTSHLPWWI